MSAVVGWAHKLGDYWLGPHIASGGRGHVFYASSLGVGAVPTAALKYPCTNRELRTLKALHEGPSPCLGVPLLYESGVHDGKPWLVMELLSKTSLKDLMRRVQRLQPPQRWPHVQVVGRLLLRRLRGVHERGFVHCDIHPSNVIFGRKTYSSPAERCLPFFVDFGLAHPHPGGEPVQPHAGTITYTSIRSGDGGARLPRDDLEALGWMLCHMVAGALPWVAMIDRVDWKDKPRRAELCKEVLEEGTVYSLEERWNVPVELAKFLRLCRQCEGKPDYEALLALLGEGSKEESPRGVDTLFDFDDLPEVPGAKETQEEAEQRDLEMLNELLKEV